MKNMFCPLRLEYDKAFFQYYQHIILTALSYVMYNYICM